MEQSNELKEYTRPIVIKRVKRGNQYRVNTGVKKTTFVDFSLGLLAFFLLLWLMNNTSDSQQASIANYFTHGNSTTHKSTSTLPKESRDSHKSIKTSQSPKNTSQKKQNLLHYNKLKAHLTDYINTRKELIPYKNQILLDVTPTGLLIHINDKENKPLFDKNSQELKYYSRSILYAISHLLKEKSYWLSIAFHSQASSDLNKEDFWTLSTNRAHAIRQALIRADIQSKKIIRVEAVINSHPEDNKKSSTPSSNKEGILLKISK